MNRGRPPTTSERSTRGPSLRARTAFFVASLVALSALLTALVSWFFLRELMLERARSRLWADAIARADAMQSWGRLQDERIGLVATGTQLRELLRAREAAEVDQATFESRTRRILTDAQSGSPDVRAIWIASPDGRVIASTDPGRLGADVSSLEAFTRGRDAPHAGLPAQTEDGYVATIATPARSTDGRPLGVVMGMVNAADIASRLATVKGGYDTLTVQLAGADGEIVELRSDDAEATERLDRLGGPMDAALSGESGFISAKTPGGREVLAAHLPVPGRDWGLAVLVDVEEAYAPVRQLGRYLMVISLVVIFVSGLLSFLLAARITRPVRTLVAAARSYEGGELDVRAQVDGPPELVELADAFDRMAAALEDHRAELEARVRLRTAELEQQIALRDEAERGVRASERRFSAVAESANDPIVSADAAGRIRYLNPAAREVFGWSDDEAIGEPLTILMPERYRQAHQRGLARFLETGEGRILGRTIELEAQRRDGTELPVELSVNAWEDLDGEPAFTAIVRDVTERVRAREELEHARDEAEDANRAKSEFLANMSHEIRTPMNGVIGMTELLLSMPLEPQQRQYADTILASAETLLSLLNDILDLSKIEAGRIEPERVPFSLRETLGDTLSTFGLRAAEKGLELVHDIEPAVPDGLIGDPIRLRQIVVNLVGNAIKFTDEGEVVVRVTVDEESDDRVRLRCDVSDTGPGIPEDVRERIFRAFEQADATVPRTHGGTGLGLTISSELARLMGGRVWVDSEVGEGSTFHFTATFGRHEGTAVSPAVALEGMRALVVDDNTTNRTVLAGLLRSWRMDAEAAASGEEGLAALRRAADEGAPFRVALLDAMMPEMDGFALAERIRDDPALAGTGMIMLSSAGRTREIARSRELGIARCMIKPVKQSDLLEAIQRLVGAQGVGREAPEPTPASADQRPLSILLAEDDPVNQRVAMRLLEKRGHTVELAENGREAVEALERGGEYDLVLMDVRMPEMDGIEATETIRAAEAERGGHVPIVAMTAHAMEGDEQRCREAGMDDYVSKPVRAEDLYAAVARAATGDGEAGRSIREGRRP